MSRAKITEEQEVAAIPLAEERVAVTKREAETGRLRIQVSVEERQDTVPVELMGRWKSSAFRSTKAVSQLPSVRLEGSTTIIPVVEEVGVVEKRLVLSGGDAEPPGPTAVPRFFAANGDSPKEPIRT